MAESAIEGVATDDVVAYETVPHPQLKQWAESFRFGFSTTPKIMISKRIVLEVLKHTVEPSSKINEYKVISVVRFWIGSVY